MSQVEAAHITLIADETIERAYLVNLAISVQCNYVVGLGEAVNYDDQIGPRKLNPEHVPALVARITVAPCRRKSPCGPKTEENTSSSVVESSPASMSSRMTNFFRA